MRKHANIEQTVRSWNVCFAYLDPMAAVYAGIAGECSALTLKLEPAWPVGVSIQNRALVDAAVTIRIPLQRGTVGRRNRQHQVTGRCGGF